MSQGPTIPACFEHTPVQLWTARPNGELEYVNRRVLTYFGRDMEAMLKWGWAALVHAEDLPGVGEGWGVSLETGAEYNVEFRLRRHDGVYLWHLGHAQAVRGPDGDIVQWAGVNTSIEALRRPGQQP